MRIVFFEAESWEKKRFERLPGEFEAEIYDYPLRAREAGGLAEVEAISTFIYSELSAETLRQLPRLRLIAARSTGVDHIDRAYCTAEGIAVCHVPGYGDNTVAEHVFALLLTISHRIWEAVDRTRRGEFSLAGLRGFDLEGKTLGVIGTGAIGRHVIRIARGFGMRVLAHDVRPDEGLAQQMGFRYAAFDEVLAQSDVITLHVPALPETRNLISAAQFARMKDGVVLINTARGAILDVRALMQALGSGKVAAAGLDVLPEEPVIREEAELLHTIFQRRHDLEALLVDHVLLRMRNVYITPHSAFATREAIERIVETTVENILAFARGRPVNLAWPLPEETRV